MDKMLDVMTPEQFTERWAADVIDPIDNTRMIAELTAAIVNEFTMALARFGEQRIQQEDMVKAEDYLPRLTKRKKKGCSIEASRKQIASMFSR